MRTDRFQWFSFKISLPTRRTLGIPVGLLLLLVLFCGMSHADELVLAQDGQSDYQIILPDESDVPESLRQVARMVQTAFKANGFDLPVALESKRQPDKPSIYIGDTAAARAAGVEVKKLPGWSYVIKVVKGDVVIAGRDHAALPSDSKRPPLERLGSAKGVTYFLHRFAGVRFLYPDLDSGLSLHQLEKVDLLNTPAISYLPMQRISLPEDTDLRVEPLVEFDGGYGRSTSATGFYHLSQNRFPLVDSLDRSHTWQAAVPVEKYGKTHPEYFALIGGERLITSKNTKNAQYCISNPQVQELFYQDLAQAFQQGYHNADLGQPDGFRPCECDPCGKLFDTEDWGEKIWILHRNLAQRAYKEYPDRVVTIMSYILTRKPPTSFTGFPPNVRIKLTGIQKHETKDWDGVQIPQGVSAYLYYWTPNLTTRYTPMQTPVALMSKVHHLIKMKVRSIYRDSPGYLYGLEGPSYYTFGRITEDPEKNDAASSLKEFVDAAFGPSGPAMLEFYNDLYDSIQVYADYLGTREPGWVYTGMNGRWRKTVRDPFRLLGFLYPPDLMERMEKNLSRAEQAAKEKKVITRLALVRREFDYLKSFATVVHLYHAYQILPERRFLMPLLDALDQRNALIASYYDEKGSALPVPEWSMPMFPPGGHWARHLRPAGNNYQGPFKETFLNWDTAAMRETMDGRTSHSTVARRKGNGVPAIDSPEWKEAKTLTLKPTGKTASLTAETKIQLLYDKTNLYVRIEADLPPGAADREESIDLHFSPVERDISYRFTIGPKATHRADAARGLIEDTMDPRYAEYDPDWSGAWDYQLSRESSGRQWLALVIIPHRTLGAPAPAAGSLWRANFTRVHPSADGLEQAIWSQRAGSSAMDEAEDFGELKF